MTPLLLANLPSRAGVSAPSRRISAVNESQGYALGRGNDGSIYKYDAFGGVWVSDGNGGTVKIGDDGGYYNPE